MSMDTFKRENFRRDHPGKSLPATTALSSEQVAALKADIAVRIGGMPTDDPQKVVRDLATQAVIVADLDASAADFDLCGLVDELHLSAAEDVLINWRHFSDVDRMRLEDLCTHFSDIWYPGSDDIEIFHPDRYWMIAVSHEGYVSYLNLV